MSVLDIRKVSKRFGSLVAVQDVSLTVQKGELRAIIGPNGAGKTTTMRFRPPTWARPHERAGTQRRRAAYLLRLSHILHDVGLQVAEGKITALLGRNGAGKTTTLRSLMGLTPPRAGRITIFGAETTHWPPYRIAAAGVGYVPEGRRIFANLSVDENLKVPLERAGSWTAARIYQLFPRLAERKQNRGRQLSGGEQEMLSIGRALLLNPRLLILDEPSQGLAPLIVREVFRIVAQMRDEGISVLLVEQNARMSLEIADYAYVLDNGTIVYSGPARELAADEARVQSLAGASAEEWTEV